MTKEKFIHWAVLEIAEQAAPGNTINLWPQIEQKTARQAHKATGEIIAVKRKQYALGLMIAILLISSLFFVPPVRAFAENIIQRMGIAFVDTDRFDPNTQIGKLEATIVSPSPSLSEAEIRQQITFTLRLPTWVPEDLIYVHRSISTYDPQTWEGSGKKVSIEYRRTANYTVGSGMLMLHANDGPISAPPLLAETREQPVNVNGQSGIYVHGGWQDDGRGDPNIRLGTLQWDDQADDAYLTWAQDGVTYLLEAHNLGLELEDLQHIAESMTE